MNPDLLPVEDLQPLGMWPNPSLTSRGIIPYIKRLRNDKVRITVVGDLKGETTADILDNCPNVFRVYSVNNYTDTETKVPYHALFVKNTEKHSQKIREKSDRNSDVVIIERSSSNNTCTSDKLQLYYDLVKSGGIFCGNGHDAQSVKDELNKFRRETKIGTPILVANLHVWFWYKR